MLVTIRRCALTALSCLLLGLLGTGALLVHEGYRVFIVHTGSMVPTFNPGDVVLDRPSTHRPDVGEVITFRHSTETTDVVTHRVVSIDANNLIHTKGDANPSPDAWRIGPTMVRGVVFLGVPGAGYVLVFLKQPAGIGSLATAVFALCLLWSLFFGDEATAPTAASDSAVDPATPQRPGPAAGADLASSAGRGRATPGAPRRSRPRRPGRHAARPQYDPISSLLS